MSIYLFIYILLISISAVLYPKSKLINLVILFTIWTLFVFSFDEYDRLYYEQMYENSTIKGATGYEMLFIEIMSSFKKLGFNFYEFRYFWGGVTVLITNYAIWKYSRLPNLVLLLYLFSQAIINALLMRHSIAFGLTLICLPLFLDTSSSHRIKIVAISLMLVSPFIHSAFWFFLLIIPYSYWVRKHPRIILIVLIFVLLFFTFTLLRNIVGMILSNLALRDGAYEKIVESSGASLNGMIYYILKYIFNFSPVLLILFLKKKYKISTSDINPIRCAFNQSIVYINLFILFLLIPQFYNTLFERLIAIQIIFNYIYVSNVIFYNLRLKRIMIPFVFIHSISYLCIKLFYESPDTYNVVWLMHLKTNSFLQLFE